MKSLKKLKIYSSLAAFATLSTIAITAASCAKTKTSETNSSKQNKPFSFENLFSQSYETLANKTKIPSDVVKELNADNLKTYINFPKIEDGKWTFTITSEANDEKGIINIVLVQIYDNQKLNKDIKFVITGFKQAIPFTTLTSVIADASRSFKSIYQVLPEKANELAEAVATNFDFEKLKNYITLPAISQGFELKVKSAVADPMAGKIAVVLTQTYDSTLLDKEISFEITGFLGDVSSLFNKSYNVKTVKANEIADEATKNLTSFEALKDYIDLPEINSNFELTIDSPLSYNEIKGTINITLEQLFVSRPVNKNISFEIMGFKAPDSSDLFVKSYPVKVTKAKETVNEAANNITSFDKLKEYIDFTQIDAKYTYNIISKSFNSIEGTIQITLSQFYNAKAINKEITIKITGLLQDASSLFNSTYQLIESKALLGAGEERANIKSYDDLKNYTNLPTINNYTFAIKSITSDDNLGTIKVVLSQTFNSQPLNKDISFEITGFMPDVSKLFKSTYSVKLAKANEFVGSIHSGNLPKNINSLKQFIDLPDNINPKVNLSINSLTKTSNSLIIDIKQEYQGHTNKKGIRIIINGFYNNQGNVTSSWIPVNDQFIRKGITNLSNKQAFNKFIVDNWNPSLANDALNAIRWVYTDPTVQQTLTNNMKEYIKTSFRKGTKDSWTLGYLMGYKWQDNNNGWQEIPFNPIYTSEVTRNEQVANQWTLTLSWSQKQYEQASSVRNYTADVSGRTSITITSTQKPIINSNGNAVISVRVNATIDNEAQNWRPTASDGANTQINILDALYYYYNQKSIAGSAIKDQMSTDGIDNTNWGRNLFLIFRSILGIKDSDTKFHYRNN